MKTRQDISYRCKIAMNINEVFIVRAQVELLQRYLRNIEEKIERVRRRLDKKGNADHGLLREELRSLMRLRKELMSSIEKLVGKHGLTLPQRTLSRSLWLGEEAGEYLFRQRRSF